MSQASRQQETDRPTRKHCRHCIKQAVDELSESFRTATKTVAVPKQEADRHPQVPKGHDYRNLDYLPKPIIRRLEALQGSEPSQYLKNVMAFYRLLAAGAFKDNEGMWVIMEREQPTHIVATKADVFKQAITDRESSYHCVSDEELPVTQKYVCTSTTGTDDAFKVMVSRAF
jgi:hypothetical protein